MPATLDDILLELQAIRTVLAARPAPSAPTHYVGPPGTPAASASTPGRFDQEPVPQPARAWPLADAEAHEIHFGKNAGTPLGKLSDNSLAFYAKEKPQRVNKSTGKPFEKRPADLDLENAARTLWHHRRGTLANPAPASAPSTPRAEAPPAAAKPTPDANLDEDVPF